VENGVGCSMCPSPGARILRAWPPPQWRLEKGKSSREAARAH